MTNHEKLLQEYEDALFALLMEEVAQAEGEAALALNERLLSDPDAAMPESMQRRCEKAIHDGFAQQNRQRARRRAWRIAKRAALAAALGALMFTTAFAVSEDFRIATVNAMIKVYENRTEIQFQGGTAAGQQRSAQSEENGGLEYQYNIALEWMPDGYEFESGKSNGSGDRISFANSIGALLEVDIHRYNEHTVYNLNTEDCSDKNVTIQGHSATLYTLNETMLQSRYTDNDMPQIWSERTVFWIDEARQIIVNIGANNMTEEEILRLAEGMSWNEHSF